MVTEFLRKYQDQLLEKRDVLKTDLNETEIEIRKQEKFISAISEDVAEPFSAFSPHATDRTKQSQIDEQNEKMDQLQFHRTQLDQEIQRLDDEIVDVERSLMEVSKVTSAENDAPDFDKGSDDGSMTSETEILSKESELSDNSTDQRPYTSSNDKVIDHDMIRQIRNARDFLPADPRRAREILTQLLNNLDH